MLVLQILDIDETAASKVARECNTRNKAATSTAFKCDVTNQEAVERIFDSVAKNNKRIDILVNNAGIGPLSQW